MFTKFNSKIIHFVFLSTIIIIFRVDLLGAWGSLTHMKITSDAYFIMPNAFKEFLGDNKSNKVLKQLIKASIEPDTKLKDFQNHVFHIHGYKMGNAPFYIENLCKEIINEINQNASKELIIQKLGWVAHYVADLAQPLHTGVETWEGIEEKEYHKKLEKDVDKNVYEFGVYFDGCFVIERISARMIYEALWANQYYNLLEKTYVLNDKSWEKSKAILQKCYSRAVNNVLDVWYTIWAKAGGKINPALDAKPKYFPPINSKKIFYRAPLPQLSNTENLDE